MYQSTATNIEAVLTIQKLFWKTTMYHTVFSTTNKHGDAVDQWLVPKTYVGHIHPVFRVQKPKVIIL